MPTVCCAAKDAQLYRSGGWGASPRINKRVMIGPSILSGRKNAHTLLFQASTRSLKKQGVGGGAALSHLQMR